MDIESIKKNELISKIVQKIIDDPKIYSKLKSNIELIFEDNKIDVKDIPYLINILTNLYKFNNIKIKKKNIKGVFILLLLKLNEELDLIENIDELLVIVDPQIDLLLYSLSKCNICCCCKPKDEDEINRLKINKIKRDKELNKKIQN